MYKTKLYPNDGSPPILLAKKTNAYDAFYAHREALKRDDIDDLQQILTTNSKGIIVAYGSNGEKLHKLTKLPAWIGL
jgi:hypothetical protein